MNIQLTEKIIHIPLHRISILKLILTFKLLTSLVLERQQPCTQTGRIRTNAQSMPSFPDNLRKCMQLPEQSGSPLRSRSL